MSARATTAHDDELVACDDDMAVSAEEPLSLFRGGDVSSREGAPIAATHRSAKMVEMRSMRPISAASSSLTSLRSRPSETLVSSQTKTLGASNVRRGWQVGSGKLAVCLR